MPGQELGDAKINRVVVCKVDGMVGFLCACDLHTTLLYLALSWGLDSPHQR